MLNKRGESGHPCLVPGLKESAFSFSPLSRMLAVGLSYMAFIMLRYIPSICISALPSSLDVTSSVKKSQ